MNNVVQAANKHFSESQQSTTIRHSQQTLSFKANAKFEDCGPAALKSGISRIWRFAMKLHTVGFCGVDDSVNLQLELVLGDRVLLAVAIAQGRLGEVGPGLPWTLESRLHLFTHCM